MPTEVETQPTVSSRESKSMTEQQAAARQRLIDMGVPSTGIDWLNLLIGIDSHPDVSFEEVVYYLYDNLMETVNEYLGCEDLRELRMIIQEQGIMHLLNQLDDDRRLEFLREALCIGNHDFTVAEDGQVDILSRTVEVGGCQVAIGVRELTYSNVQFESPTHIAQEEFILSALGRRDLIVNLSAGDGRFLIRQAMQANSVLAGCFTVWEALSTSYRLEFLKRASDEVRFLYDVTLVDLRRPETLTALKLRLESLGFDEEQIDRADYELIATGSTAALEGILAKIGAFWANKHWILKYPEYVSRSASVNASPDGRIRTTDLSRLNNRWFPLSVRRIAGAVEMIHYKLRSALNVPTDTRTRVGIVMPYLLQVLDRNTFGDLVAQIEALTK